MAQRMDDESATRASGTAPTDTGDPAVGDIDAAGPGGSTGAAAESAATNRVRKAQAKTTGSPPATKGPARATDAGTSPDEPAAPPEPERPVEPAALAAVHATPERIVVTGGLPQADASTLEVSRGGIGRANARDVSVSMGGIGYARADRVTVELGGIGAAIAGEVEVRQGGVNAIVAREVEVEQAFVQSVVAANAEIEEGANVLILVAGRVTGNVRPLLDWRGGLAAGAAFGLLVGILRRRE